MAVAKYNAALARGNGFSPWVTYGGRNYLADLQPSIFTGGPQTTAAITGGYVSPVGAGAQYARTDQGVDYTNPGNYLAPGAGTIYGTSGFGGGTDQAVYERLFNPITVNGRTYQDIYAAETNPLVHAGETVYAGQPLQGPGAGEIGFAGAGTSPYAPLIGGLGAGTQATQAGADYLAFIQRMLGTAA
jgi:hypothetical protein